MATVREVKDLTNITVNGIPIARVIDEEIRHEIRTNHQAELKSLSFVKQLHIPTSTMRNHSGARSGRGRVIFSVGGAA